MKYLSLIILGLSCCMTVQAQTSYGLRVGFGINYQNKPDQIVGPYAGFLPENPADPINLILIGGQFGLVAKQQLNSIFSIYTDFSLEQIGGKFKIISADLDGSFIDHENTSKLYYLSVPVLLQYHVWENISLDFGPKVGYLIAEDRWFEADLNLDYGLVIGSTYKVDAFTDLQLRYYFGFAATSDIVYVYPADVIQGEHDFKNRSLQFSLIRYFNKK